MVLHISQKPAQRRPSIIASAQLESWRSASGVSDAENLDLPAEFIDSIIGVQWGVQELTNSSLTLHRAPQMREILQQIDVVKESLAEPLRWSQGAFPTTSA
jgi:uncharacterized protein involved in exopolysaccharide biosynthesis